MKIRKLLIAVFCVLLLSGCGGNRQAIGRVTAYENGILSVRTWEGKDCDFLVDPEQTRILGLTEDEEDPLGDGSDRQVQVTYSKKQGKYLAQTVFVSARLRRSAMTLSDGTPIDVWEQKSSREYCLRDGTVLLVEDLPEAMETSGRWQRLAAEDFPEAAQQGILNYYETMEKRYDVPVLLENAYLGRSLSEEFGNHFVSQQPSIEDWNERIICCKMSLILPIANSNGGNQSFWEGAVFDRQTGEHISGFDLFTITPEELEECIWEQLDSEGIMDREKIQLNLKPEQIVLCQDGDIAFYLVDRVENGVVSMLEVTLDANKAKEILQPWAWVGLGD